MADPLSRSTQKTDPNGNKGQVSKAKEFERQLQEQEKQMTGGSFPQSSNQITVIHSYQQQQQQNTQSGGQSQQPQQSTSMFGNLLEAPRKLFFRNTSSTPQQPQQSQQPQKDTVEWENVQAPPTQPTVHRDISQLGLNQILPGEVSIQEAKAQCFFMNFNTYGTLAVTNYQFVFLPEKSLKNIRRDFFYVPYTMINKFERAQEKKQSDSAFVDVSVKDGRVFKFRFSLDQSQYHEVNSLINAIIRQAFSGNKNILFAFQYFKEAKELEESKQGWKMYDITKDFARMKITIAQEGEQQQLQQSLFKYVNNDNGNICTTYYHTLIIPFKVEPDILKLVAKFRSKERIPILSYAIPISEKKIVSLWRSSQCRVGISSNRSPEDEWYLRQMAVQGIDDNDLSLNGDVNLRIYDARPHLNALGQQVAGKGYENTMYYKKCTIDFLDIHNIHKVRDAHIKFQKSALSDSTQMLSQFEISVWYDHIIAIIQGAARVASTLVKEQINVLVHCSDGWDRTSQLIALTELMIDPYYRTIEGIMMLIQKEFVNAGHQFAQRSGIGNRQYNDDQRAPIFLQFLDCIYQLMQLYPLSFEFNSRLLLDLAYHHYSSLFGTFICDSYLEASKQKVIEGTVSIWSWMSNHKDKYLNPYYKSASNLDKSVLIPDAFSGKSVTVWKEYFTYYSLESFDTYQIFPESTFTSDNIQTMFKAMQLENHRLRQASLDQETLTSIQSQKLKQLMQIILESGNEELLGQLENINVI